MQRLPAVLAQVWTGDPPPALINRTQCALAGCYAPVINPSGYLLSPTRMLVAATVFHGFGDRTLTTHPNSGTISGFWSPGFQHLIVALYAVDTYTHALTLLPASVATLPSCSPTAPCGFEEAASRAAHGALPHRAPFTTRCTADLVHHVWHRRPPTLASRGGATAGSSWRTTGGCPSRGAPARRAVGGSGGARVPTRCATAASRWTKAAPPPTVRPSVWSSAPAATRRRRTRRGRSASTARSPACSGTSARGVWTRRTGRTSARARAPEHPALLRRCRRPTSSCTSGRRASSSSAAPRAAHGALPCRAPSPRCTAQSMHHVWHRQRPALEHVRADGAARHSARRRRAWRRQHERGVAERRAGAPQVHRPGGEAPHRGAARGVA